MRRFARNLARLSPPERISKPEGEIQDINRQKNDAAERQILKKSF